MLFEFGQASARLLHHRLRQAGQRGDLQAEAAVGRAVLDRVHEHQRVAVLDRIQVHVGDAAAGLGQRGQLEIVRGEQGVGSD